MKRSLCIEFLIITLVGVFYFALCAPISLTAGQSSVALDLRPINTMLVDPTIRPSGVEHERLAGIIVPIRIGLQRYGDIPFWNSYLSNGVPIINNGFNYLFNPFHSLPVLILGEVMGSKVAILLALLIAGYNMWALGYVIGLGSLARVSIACLYAINGGITAKFGGGHFQLACSLAWPPLVIAALWLLLHTPKRIAPVAFGISFALLFYAGNIYYTLHTLFCCIVILAVHLINRIQSRWHFHYDRFLRVLAAAAIAFGLSALQFFPVWQTRDFVTHQQQEINADGALVNNYDLTQAAVNLTQTWYAWNNHHPDFLFPVVDYTYIGTTTFVLISLAFALWITNLLRQKKHARAFPYARLIPVAIFLALAMMLWAGGQVQPVPWLYAQIPLLAQFRYLGRALAIAALWWIVLGGIALDILWKALLDYANQRPSIKFPNRIHIILIVGASTCIWLYMLIYSASPSGTRISMVLRNVYLWQDLDLLRYTSLSQALRGFAGILLVFSVLDIIILLGQQTLQVFILKQHFIRSRLLTYVSQIVLLGLVTLGIMDVMITNAPSLQFTTFEASFTPIYDTIRRLDTERPFPFVAIPFSPLTFEVYNKEIRAWSLNEGWLPAAPTKGIITMGQFSNLPRWLIAERDANGNIYDPRVASFVKENHYERRLCFRQDTITEKVEDCSAYVIGADLYELPQALPYAFLVTESVLTNNPTSLRRDNVIPANILDYQQDTITISTTSTSSVRQFLVIQEANFPGWRVTVNGLPIQPITVPTEFIGKQTLGLLAIPIEKGSHTVTLSFEPPGLTTGIFVFLGTLILITIYLTHPTKQKSPA